MPLTRYEIRNEYSLADPVLYRAADKDDPEALLEGVAMAGLVGVLRQLGDLAEFAAEIFHDLHEEVMATAAREHGLMVRVQQVEAEVPPIERAFLSKTNHTPFFSNAGIDWHQNVQMKQNVLTRGDLPRCVMDSYEECRGPPQLFFLDKFDVAGAGACLKRYTDPSFFKAEATSTAGVYRERKVRKAKKKGPRWRNGETPEVLPKSHPKLQQLLLEERVENGVSNPARLVKLKRRQWNDPKSGRSYMEKFLGTPSPENKMVRDISVAPLALKWTPDSYSESELEVVDIKTMSSAEKSLEGKGNPRSFSPDHEVVVKSTTEGFNGHVNDRRIVPVSELISDGKNDEMPSIHPRMVFEKELLVDKGDIEGSIDGENSDNMTSEVENYMDALATMESELDTDNEYISKNYVCSPNAKKGSRTDSDGNEEEFKAQVHFSDSQSIGNSSVSEDCNGSFKRGRFSFSCSDTVSNMAENVPSDGEGASNLFPTIETYEAISTSSNKHAYQEMSDSKPCELEKACDTKLSEVGETDPEPESLIVSSASPAQRRIESLSMDSDESNSKCLNSEDSNVFSNSSPVSQENSNDMSFEESLQTDHVHETCTQKLVDAKIDSPRSIVSPAEDLGSVSEVVTSKGLNSVVDSSKAHSFSKEQFSDSAHYVSTEPEVPHSEEHTNVNCTSVMADGEEIFDSHDTLDDLQSNPPSCNDHVSSGDPETDEVGKIVSAVAQDAAARSSVDDDNEVVNLSEDLFFSLSQELVHLEESRSGSTDSSEELNSNEAFPSQSEAKTEVEVECQQADEASLPSDHIDQQACFDSCKDNLPQPIASEFSPQSNDQEFDHTNREMKSLFSFLPSSGFVSQTSEITANEMPPMPPLLWRMGKVHHVTEDQRRELLFPSMSLFSSNEKTHSGFPALDSVATLPGNQLIAVEDADPQYVSEELTNHVVQPTPLYEFPDLGDEIPEPGLNVPVTEDSSSRQDAISSDEICMEAKTHQRLTNNSEAEHINNPSETASAPLPREEEEEEPHLHTLEGQLIWPSNALALAPTFEIEPPNGNTVPKILRPRSPLVDALAAHDKSMLRKVTDRPRARPQIEPKDDDRGSFLKQIRTKSFNLKPALVSKPSIQGPKPNLRLAAILEKANAIRQATAGSDEDDEDSWSDEN